MQSVLWFILIFSASEASSEETSLSSSELQSPALALADVIYDKQKECDAIVGEAVVKALEKGINNKFPVPDERYLQCRKSLDEKKKEYIKTALVGLNYYSTLFPMRLSNKKLVTLPVPADESLSAAADSEFDIQQEICMTNKLCLTLVRLKFSKYDVEDINEQKKSVKRCLTFLNELKSKYIDVKKREGTVFEKGLGLQVMCTDGAVTLTLPENEHDMTSPSTAPEIPKITPAAGNDVEKEDSTTNKLESYNPFRDPYNEVAREIKSLSEQRSKDQDKADKHSENEDPSSDSEDDEETEKEEAEKGKTMAHDETITQEGVLPDFKTEGVTTEDLNGSDHPVNEISFRNSKPDEETAKSDPSEDVDSSQEEDKLNTSTTKDNEEVAKSETSEDLRPAQEKEKISTMKSEDTLERNQNTKTEAFENIPTLEDAEMSPNKDDELINERTESTTKSGKKRPQKPIDVDNVELVSYRVKVVTKNVNGKVVKIQASGRIKKTETGDLTPNQPSLNIGPKSDGSAESKSDLRHVNAPTEINEAKRRHPDSLEDNIILMENDCKELLQFGEHLLQHKMLSSLIHLENHYNECVKRLDTLKKMYIEKHQLDVMSHKNIFSLTLTSGDPKLVPLPTQFLKTDLVETQSSSNLSPDDVFELREFFRKNDQSENPTLDHREPFDDPAFISNDEFLKSLQQGAASSDTSTFSRVASMLHMNGGHTEKKIAE